MTPAPLRARIVLLVWLASAAMIAYVQRMSIAVAEEQIRLSLQMSIPLMGLVMSGYYWAYALSQVPMSWLGQRLGTRWMLPLSVAGASLMAALMAVCFGGAQLATVWLLAGVAIAGIFPSCVRSIGGWFPVDGRAFPSGVLGSSMSVGGAVSTALTGWLLVVWASESIEAWRLVFLAYALPGVLWAMGFWLWYRERPAAGNVSDASKAPAAGMRPALPAPLDRPGWLLDRRTWLICGQQFFRASGYVFYGTWFPTYLQEAHQVSLASAGWLTSLPLMGVVLGGFMGGALCDWLERTTGSKRISRQAVGIVVHATCGLLVISAQWAVDPLVAVAVISVGAAINALGGSGSYAVTMDLGGSRTSTLFALMNMCGNFGAALSPMVVGVLVGWIGWAPILNLFGGIYLAAAACWVFLNPSR